MKLKTSYYMFAPLFSLMACQEPSSCPDKAGTRVCVTTVKESASDRHHRFPVIAMPYSESALSFRVGGPAGYSDLQPGQYFRHGETIAQIDSRDFQIRKDRSEALYRQARQEFRRISALYEKDNVSGSSFEKAMADLAVAKANYETACNELSDTRLTAPFDGYIQQVYIEPYQDIRAGQAAVSFIATHKLKVNCYIPERLAQTLGQPADSLTRFELHFATLPGQTFIPSRIELSKSTTANNISYQLTATVDNADGRLMGGMNGTLSVILPEAARTAEYEVPQQAICHSDDNGTYVWRINPQQSRAEKVPVTLQTLIAGQAIVSGPLYSGDRLAITQLTQLSDQEEVTIQQQP